VVESRVDLNLRVLWWMVCGMASNSTKATEAAQALAAEGDAAGKVAGKAAEVGYEVAVDAGLAPEIPATAVGGGENQDRRLVVHETANNDLDPEDDEDECVFEEEGPNAGRCEGRFAMARYYSSRSFPTKILFVDLFKVWGEGTARDLGDNRYLLEFESQRCLNFVLRGGPWTFKGDAIIIVHYDGMSRCSEVLVESIPLWIRIYDIPIAMMTAGFVSALAGKVGRVLEVGEAVKDFQRVQVDFALSNPLNNCVWIRVRAHGIMEFLVRYENVPFFCFGCGRIGHAKRECPDEVLEEGGVKFGTELRTSPFKRSSGRLLSFQAPPQ
jgi:hypothetical protein